MAVARLEFSPETPIFASSAVTPAKNADENAQKNHCMSVMLGERFYVAGGEIRLSVSILK